MLDNSSKYLKAIVKGNYQKIVTHKE